MALIKCKEWGHEISDAATNCRHCGAPVKPEKTAPSNTKTYMIIAIIVGVISLLISVMNSGPGSIAQQNATVTFAALGIISIVVALILFIRSKNGQ